jgi:hypothetical protein
MKIGCLFHSLLKEIQGCDLECMPSAHSALQEGVPERTRALRRFGSADHVNEGAQRGWDLTVSGIKQEEPFQAGWESLQDAHQLACTQERLSERLDGICNSEPIDGCTNCEIWVVDGHCARASFIRLVLPFRSSDYGRGVHWS